MELLLIKKAKSIKKQIIYGFCVIFMFELILFPMPILASEYENNVKINIENEENANNEINEEEEKPLIEAQLPENNDLKVKYSKNIVVTAYNSEISQCDAAPCITANGFNLCKHGIEDSIAANFLKFGTKVKIPGLYGDKVFIVRDRMNSRYNDRIDIWMAEKEKAIEFGVKSAKIEILE